VARVAFGVRHRELRATEVPQATPVLKPVMTVSEMKFTRLPALTSQAARGAVAAASAA
jgi:hypothetical protein